MSFTRRLFIAVLLLLVASCSGGGCSSGCAACGTTPLPGGFPKPETIPNAASVRVTRPGLDFVQANLSTLAVKALGTNAKNGVASFQIPKSSQSGATICPNANPKPPECTAELDIGTMKVRVNSITPNRVKLDGLLPVRISNLPVSAFGLNLWVVAGDASKAPSSNLCSTSIRGAATFPYKEVPVNVELPLVTETRVPRGGYTKLDVDNAVIDIGVTKDDVEFCASCGIAQGLCDGITGLVKDFAFNSLVDGIKSQIKGMLGSAFCTAPTPTVTPPCPNGSEPDNTDLTKATRCEFIGTSECVPALLGADGRMDLSQALAKFSPGTTGGLDFVLASAGDMNPAPGEATVPAWTPRKPPVPAEDNNKNGISLTMLGGAIPQPLSTCVETVRRDPPKGIPIPKEMTDDSGSTHLGIALAGRYLDHALLGAYNSGALCMGISTESIAQLSSGTLSLLAPSIKSMTLEGQNAAAGITTRPGAPPKIVIGDQPLLTVTLERLALDFHVWSYDRFVRIFTYTADVTVPVDLQTGKSEKNPNGGILPVLGNIKVGSAKVTNNTVLFEDDARLADGVTGLLGGIVGQLLGGGFSAIDLSSSLASTGLAVDIPPNGIRKLTSGTDDFIGVFANLKPAATTAREEVETRATLLGKIVDRDAMALDTAVRARFPKLRVRVDSIASKPTETTWWIDDGTRSKWTTDKEIVVDQDAMLLQGKHVLHVASRIVDDTISEDGTPAEIPFTIDTLAPRIETTRDGDRVRVEVSDFVSAPEAIRVRWRAPGAEWTEWSAAREVPASADEIEAIDEEGNIGRVSLGLRGVADPTLAAGGSGCGCKTTPDAGTSAPLALASVLALALVGRRRRNRA